MFRPSLSAVAPPVFHAAYSALTIQRRKRTGKERERSRKRCAPHAHSAIRIAPESGRSGFVTAAYSSAGIDPDPCTRCEHKRSQNPCTACAQSAIRMTPESHRYGLVTATFSCAGGNSLAGDEDGVTAAEVIARAVSGRCTSSVRERSQNGSSLCAGPAIRLVANSDRYRFMTAAFSCIHRWSGSGELAAPKVHRRCASCPLRVGARARTAFLPKLRLGETHVPVVVLTGGKKLLPVVVDLRYARH